MNFLTRCSKNVRIINASRRIHSSTSLANEGIREQLLAGVKQAMKNKDHVSSMTLRSVLSEVYNLDKSSGSNISSSAVIGVLRKAVLRRTESASQFVKGERPDLAKTEVCEAEIISAFLPPMLSEAEIDRVLKEVAPSCPQDGNPKKILGSIFKSFYSKVDKANVDSDLVKSRAEALLNL
ncbi:GatB YqeY domain-containing protein [Boletus edulis BED1]|uniref:Altered inheritance of mitochondria protein 41 n=1 Tax=Boletus edulis BED1 TaxID=1328754 RepID=A0AAD4BVV8_BOLED|nr:GatB YqeY domain-containing protein [Boletus edulis BED1]